MIYIRLFTNPLSQIAQAMTSVQSAAAASERIFDFLDEEELDDESHKNVVLPEIKGNVNIQNIKFEDIHIYTGNNSGSNVGVIRRTEGNMKDVKFNNITIIIYTFYIFYFQDIISFFFKKYKILL